MGEKSDDRLAYVGPSLIISSYAVVMFAAFSAVDGGSINLPHAFSTSVSAVTAAFGG